MSIGIHTSRYVWRIGMALLALRALMIAPFGTASAQTRTTEVDPELVLLVDVSRSMSGAELELRRRGITINGLPLMVDDGWNTYFRLPDLDVYYRNCVIGGAGAFVIPVYGWPDLPDAVRRMLMLEIANLAPPARIIRAQSALRDPRDCGVGEKISQGFVNERNFCTP